MTVSTLARSVTYTGNGSATSFAVPFKVLDTSHLVVKRLIAATGAVDHTYIGTEFSYSGIGHDAGTLTLVGTPLSSLYKLLIERVVPYRQELNLINAGGFYPETVEDQLDLITMGIQQVGAQSDDLASRALLVPIGQTAPSYDDFKDAFKGNPGGNVESVGTFASLVTLPALVGTDRIRTSGRSSAGKGGGIYDRWKAPMVALPVSGQNVWWKQTNLGDRWFLSEDQELTIEMFNAVGDGVTNDYAAWLGYKDLCDFLKATLGGNSYYKAVPKVMWGRHAYLIDPGVAGMAFDLTDGAYHIVCNPRTTIYVAAGKCGLVVQSWDTTGVSGISANTPRGGQGSIVERMNLKSLGGTVGAEQHGFINRGAAVLIDCYAEDFGGDGFQIAADTSLGDGNANLWRMVRCAAYKCGRDGLSVGPTATTSADTNAGTNYGFSAISCGRYGIRDFSFLGNHHVGFHIAACGQVASHPSWAANQAPSRCTDAGANYVYRVIPEQAAGASVNAPSGNRTDNTWWHYVCDATPTYKTNNGGSANNADQPVWSNGMAIREGGAVYHGGASSPSFFEGYMEVDENIAGSMNAGWGSQAMVAMGQNQAWHRGVHLRSNVFSGVMGIATKLFAASQTNLAGKRVETYFGGLADDAHLGYYHETKLPSAAYLMWKGGALNELAMTYGALDDPAYWAYYLTGLGTTNPIGDNRMGFPKGFGLGEGTSTIKVLPGTGSPEGVVTGRIGSVYTRTDGGAGTTLYVKESGTGNTGWVAK